MDELLQSILGQDRDDLEVVVSDDASTDNTPELVALYADKLRNMRFVRQDQNLGLDLNFLSVIENASGDYVWLMGDDDQLEAGSLAVVIRTLESWPDVAGLTVGVIDYDHNISKPTGIRDMPETQLFQDVETLFTTMVEALGFMSALIIDRTKWLSVAQEQKTKEFSNYYIQVYIIGQVTRRYGHWGALKTACVRYRSDNDQFLARLGWFERLRIDVIAYTQIAADLFGENSEVFGIVQQRVFRSHVISRVINAKVSSKATDVGNAILLLYKHYKNVPEFWYKLLPILLAPKLAVQLTRKIYKSLPYLSGASRARRISTPKPV